MLLTFRFIVIIVIILLQIPPALDHNLFSTGVIILGVLLLLRMIIRNERECSEEMPE